VCRRGISSFFFFYLWGRRGVVLQSKMIFEHVSSLFFPTAFWLFFRELLRLREVLRAKRLLHFFILAGYINDSLTSSLRVLSYCCMNLLTIPSILPSDAWTKNTFSSTVEVPRITALLTHTAPAMQQKQGAASFCPYRGRRWNDLSRWVKISRRLLGTLGYRVWWANFFLDAANRWFERERSRLFLAWPSKCRIAPVPN